MGSQYSHLKCLSTKELRLYKETLTKIHKSLIHLGFLYSKTCGTLATMANAHEIIGDEWAERASELACRKAPRSKKL